MYSASYNHSAVKWYFPCVCYVSIVKVVDPWQFKLVDPNCVSLYYLWFRLTFIACSISLPAIDLHAAWIRKNAYFICLVILLSVSLFLYLVASLIDPGFLPKSDPPLPSLKPSSESQSTSSFPDKVGIHWTIALLLFNSGTTVLSIVLFLGRKLVSAQPLKLFPPVKLSRGQWLEPQVQMNGLLLWLRLYELVWVISYSHVF